MSAAWLLTLAASAGASLTPTCVGQATSRSSGEAAVRHVFQNGEKVPLTLWWVDSDGKRTDLGPIAPGAIKSLQTTIGHAFVLTDRRGRCRAAVRVGDVLSGTYVGASRYHAVAVPGWHVYLNRALDPAAEPARGALAMISRMLRDVETTVPAAVVAQLRRTPVFLHRHAGSAAMFHFLPDWLVANGRTVELTDAIEISDAAIFVEDGAERPVQLLHELAHAYHAKLPPDDRAAIEATYRRAMAAGLYQRVERQNGTIGPAYANYSPFEYFAELSEAWFGRNDFAPFTRADLTAYDPEGARLMARIWR